MFRFNPVTIKQWRRFRSLRRGWWSFVILCVLCVLGVFAELWINKRPLVVRHDGRWYFPTYSGFHSGREFGLEYDYEVSYRQLRDKWRAEGAKSWLLMPLIPWDPYENDFREGAQHPLPLDILTMAQV